MEKTINELLLEMREGVAAVADENPVLKAKKAAKLVFNIILKLKDFAVAYQFPDQETQIRFFKEFKPVFVSELYYHLKIYRLESERPDPRHMQKKYLHTKLKAIANWLDAHKEFSKYIRSGETAHDPEYYLPGHHNEFTPLFSFDSDPAFCTAKGHEAALLIANKRLAAELEGRLTTLKKNTGSWLSLPKLKWTLKAIDMVELIYGLYLTGAINNGKAELKDIAETFGQVFDVKLDNYSFTFTQSIHYRKSGSIRFLREMIEAILKKLDELDGK